MTTEDLDLLASHAIRHEASDATDMTINEEEEATELTIRDDEEEEEATELTIMDDEEKESGKSAHPALSLRIPASEMAVRDIAVEAAPAASLPADSEAAFGQWLAASRLTPRG